jgi:hypothetical protein
MRRNNPEVVIDLPDHLIDFLYHEFGETPEGAILLDTRNDFGKYINSMWEPSEYPVKSTKATNPCRISLPIRQYSHYLFKTTYIHIPEYKHKMLIDHIKGEFELRRKEYFHVGYQKGYKQNLIIEAFMKAYGIKKNSQNFDQIKKLDYRNREKLKKTIHDDIQSAVV